MSDVPKPAMRFTGLRILIAAHVTAVIIVAVFDILDRHGMLAQPADTWQHRLSQMLAIPAVLSIFVFPLAVLIAAVLRGWCLETAVALAAEVVLLIGHLIADALASQ
jgi:hypothetical protein